MNRFLSRRPRARWLAAVTAAALVVSACGGDDGDSSDTTAASQTTAGSETTTANGDASTTTAADTPDGAFPVTFETAFGTTVIESRPERVVSVGYTEGDLILALGVTPVAIRDWYGEQPGGLWPWAAESPAAQAGEIEALDSSELNLERIAALQPDIIFAIGSGIEQAEYDALAGIAPVVARPPDSTTFGTPWDEAQIMIGKALGLEAEATALVDDVKAQIQAVADAHPEWAGRTGSFTSISTDGAVAAFVDGDNRGHMLTQLGFVIPDEITAAAGDSFYADLSGEQIGLVDTDLLLYTTYPTSDRATVEAMPLFQALAAVTEGRAAFIDDELGGAMAFSSTLSIPYALDALVPLIETALG